MKEFELIIQIEYQSAIYHLIQSPKNLALVLIKWEFGA